MITEKQAKAFVEAAKMFCGGADNLEKAFSEANAEFAELDDRNRVIKFCDYQLYPLLLDVFTTGFIVIFCFIKPFFAGAKYAWNELDY